MRGRWLVAIVCLCRNRGQPTDDFDSPWKVAPQRYLRSFLLFFWPDIHADVDWSRDYEALDKGFQQLKRRAKVGKRLVDNLFKICLGDGATMRRRCNVAAHGDGGA